MAKPSFLLQGVKKANDHETAVRRLFSLPHVTEVLLSVAFVRESGVLQLSKILKEYSKITKVIAGIRNGITSAQGLMALLGCKVTLYVVDTGALSPIFHPKLYMALSQTAGYVITGSANLTTPGLSQNIEASTVLKLDRNDAHDELFIGDLLNSTSSLCSNFPDHITKITSTKQIVTLLDEGRIEDERVVSRPQVKKLKRNLRRDKLKRIKLHIKAPDFERPPKRKKPAISRRKLAQSKPDAVELVWVSKGLTERDLNIPTGTNTNQTGSMLFKKGEFGDIDQRSFFRSEVFAGLQWNNDARPKYNHLERSQADFEIVIKGITYGVHNLKLTHNSKTNTATYKQHNAMTQIHWGKVKNFIAQRDLLNRELRLYRRLDDDTSFIIEID